MICTEKIKKIEAFYASIPKKSQLHRLVKGDRKDRDEYSRHTLNTETSQYSASVTSRLKTKLFERIQSIFEKKKNTILEAVRELE
jgi:hypothetical protein